MTAQPKSATGHEFEAYRAKRKAIHDELLAELKPVDADYQAKRKLIVDSYLARLRLLDEEVS